MPPKATPLFCLVHGDPETFVFGIKYDRNMTINELKEAILNRKKNTFVNIDSANLALYQVDIDLNTQNPR
ncbi:hypothetical protein GLOIN_2v1639645 [Rhizophagus clarus]|uniref:Crinkler effector protein N-terminal domain-containing protein n=1 Tax=Rhizophagus clarus TaxID=94130 RepID=A0A8H3L0J7_9GLOM|nr:hypothetical protein GLOIN_2v1639645 [Rhizophagus clarus]